MKIRDMIGISDSCIQHSHCHCSKLIVRLLYIGGLLSVKTIVAIHRYSLLIEMFQGIKDLRAGGGRW